MRKRRTLFNGINRILWTHLSKKHWRISEIFSTMEVMILNYWIQYFIKLSKNDCWNGWPWDWSDNTMWMCGPDYMHGLMSSWGRTRSENDKRKKSRNGKKSQTPSCLMERWKPGVCPKGIILIMFSPTGITRGTTSIQTWKAIFDEDTLFQSSVSHAVWRWQRFEVRMEEVTSSPFSTPSYHGIL